jgi:hypothetical protein
MAKSFLTSIQLNGNSLLNGRVDARWSATPSGTTNPDGTGTAVAGQISSYGGTLYVFSGLAWAALSTGSGTVTAVTGTSPVVSSGGTTPAISLAANYGDTLNPYAAKTANYVLAAPNGSSAAPTFRALVAADIPTLNQNTTGSAATLTTARTINGTSFNGSANITITAANPNALTIGTGLSGTSYDGSGAVTIAANTASTSAAGIVQLSDSTSTTGSTKAATETAVKAAYDRGSTGVTNAATAQSTADAALPKAGGTMSGAIAMGGSKITGLGTPTDAGDAATKSYVDNVSTGVNIHDAVVAATTGTIAGVYAAGSTTANPPGDGGTGVGATITYSSTGVVTLDTSVTLAAGDRVLVKDGTTALSGASSVANGIYVVTTAGAVGTAAILTRSTDADNSHFGDLSAGDLVYIIGGDTYAGDQFVQTVKGTATSGTGADLTYSVKIGTDAVSYTQFSGAGAVPAATNLVLGIASFSSTYFTVTSGAVALSGLGSLSTTGSAATLTTSRTLWGQSFNGSANVTGAITGATTITGTAATAFIAQAADYASTSGQGPHTYIKGGYATAATGTAQGGNVYIWAGGTDSVSGTAGSVNIGSGEAVNITGPATISGVVKLPNVQSGSAGFVKIAATTGQLSTASIAYSDLPTNVGVVARKVSLVGTGSGTTIALTHGLGTNLVTAQVYDTSTSTATLVETDITVTSTVATATFGATTTLSNYTLVVVG